MGHLVDRTPYFLEIQGKSSDYIVRMSLHGKQFKRFLSKTLLKFLQRLLPLPGFALHLLFYSNSRLQLLMRQHSLYLGHRIHNQFNRQQLFLTVSTATLHRRFLPVEMEVEQHHLGVDEQSVSEVDMVGLLLHQLVHHGQQRTTLLAIPIHTLQQNILSSLTFPPLDLINSQTADRQLIPKFTLQHRHSLLLIPLGSLHPLDHRNHLQVVPLPLILLLSRNGTHSPLQTRPQLQKHTHFLYFAIGDHLDASVVEILPENGNALMLGVEQRIEDRPSFEAVAAGLALRLPEAKIVNLAVVGMLGKIGHEQYLPPLDGQMRQTGPNVELEPCIGLMRIVTALEQRSLGDSFNIGVDERCAVLHFLQHQHQQWKIEQILLYLAVVLEVVLLQEVLALEPDAHAHAIVAPTAEVLAQTGKHSVLKLDCPLQLHHLPALLLLPLQHGGRPDSLEGGDDGSAQDSVHPAPDGVLDEHREIVVVAVVLAGQRVGGQVPHELLEDLADFAAVVLEAPAEAVDAVQVGPLRLHGVRLPGPPLLHHAVDLVPQSLYLRTHAALTVTLLLLLHRLRSYRQSGALLGEEDALETTQLLLLGHQIEIPLAHSKSNNNCLRANNKRNVPWAGLSAGWEQDREGGLQQIIGMKQQQGETEGHFVIERTTTAGPYHSFHQKRVTNLQSKVHFYEGQLDPLHTQNMALKDHLNRLTKTVSSSAEQLRLLLPTHDNPAKKLKLDMASLEEIAAMISHDWKEMEHQIATLNERIAQLQREKETETNRYLDQHRCRLQETQSLQAQQAAMKEQYECQLEELRRLMQLQASQQREALEQLQGELSLKQNYCSSILKQFQLYRREALCQYDEYEKRIRRQKAEIEASLHEFEQGKRMLKELFEKMLQEKQAEHAETLAAVMKIRDEERMNAAVHLMEQQEEFKRQMAERDAEVNNYKLAADRLKQQVAAGKEEVWQANHKLDEERKENKRMESEINQLKDGFKFYQKKLSQKNEEISKQATQIKDMLIKHQKELNTLKEEGNSAVGRLLKEKNQLEINLNQKTNALEETKKQLEKTQERWQMKLNILQEKWMEKETELNNQIVNRDKKIEQEQKKLHQLSLLKEDELKSLKREHQKQVEMLEYNHKLTKDELMRDFKSQINKLNDLNEDELIKAKLNFQRDLDEVTQKANQRMQKLQETHSKHLAELEENRQLQRQALQQQLQESLNQNEAYQQKLQKAEKKLQQHDQEIEKIRGDHYKAMKRMEELNESQKRSLNEAIEKQMRDFQKEIEQREALINSIRADMENEIQQLKGSSAIQNIEKKFLNEISQLKQDFALKYKRLEEEGQARYTKLQETNKLLLQKLQEEHKHQLKTLNDTHQTATATLTRTNEQDLVRIAEIIEDSRTFLNDRVLLGYSSQLQALPHQDKVNYILTTASDQKKKGEAKDKLISEFDYLMSSKQSEIEEMQRTIEHRIQAKKEELERMKELLNRECAEKINNIVSECNAKISSIEKERLKHTQMLYQEFSTMREEHEQEYGLLKKRYNQLEKLFEERPSRVEDVTKIKELLNLQTKMDGEIKTYHKKMETANEIVRYLNLELENYKQAYDIFGPTDANTSPFKTVSHPNDSPNTVDLIRHHKHEKAKEESKYIPRQSLPNIRHNESPLVKELKVFGDADFSNESFVMQPKQIPNQRDRKYSYINNTPERTDKNASLRERFKTEKPEKQQKTDKQGELLSNAQNFMKLIKGKKSEGVIRQLQHQDYSKKKTYRRRKVIKRMATIDAEHYI